jgi:hypothetical protein
MGLYIYPAFDSFKLFIIRQLISCLFIIYFDNSYSIQIWCRLAAVVLTAPVINYRWPRFPEKLARQVYRKQKLGDQWSLRISYYAPSILHWWLEQSWLPTSSVIKGTTRRPNKLDAEIAQKRLAGGSFDRVS